MIKTVKDVFDHRADLLKLLDRHNWRGDDRRQHQAVAYSWAAVNSVAVIPDQVALLMVEALYIHNTQFVPGRLPGNAMAVGDIVTHEGSQLLTVDWRVLNQNVLMLHASRPYEARCAEKAQAGREGRDAFQQLDTELRDHRHKHSHKGTPEVSDGLFILTSPAASGGASWHSMVCSDDVSAAVPHHSALFMIGSQAGLTGVMHIGHGSVVGKHFVFALPKEPLLAIQALVDQDQALIDLWPQVQEAGADFVNVDKWDEATLRHKQEVVRAVAPEIIRERVLGFHLDLTVGQRGALLSPVVTESHLAQYRDQLPEVQVKRHPFADFYMETNDRYGRLVSMFDPPAAVA